MALRRRSRTWNLSIAGISALTGCVSLLITLVALVAGLWLDSLLGQRGPATLCLLGLSVPISLMLMIRIALALIRRIGPPVAVEDGKVLSREKEEESFESSGIR